MKKQLVLRRGISAIFLICTERNSIRRRGALMA